MPGASYTSFAEFGRAFGLDLSQVGTNGIQLGNGASVSGTVYSGSGAPAAGLGVNGDFYFRTDTPATLAQRIYIKSAGSWINALA